MTHESMRARYRRLTEGLDELLLDYLKRHPTAEVNGLVVTALRDWAAAEGRDLPPHAPTGPTRK